MLRNFVEERNWQQYHTPKDLAIAIATEASEIMEHFRFRNGEDLRIYLENNKKELGHELADVLAFFSQIGGRNRNRLS